MFLFIVDTLKRVCIGLFFSGFKFREVSLEICLTTPHYLPVIFNFVRTVTLDVFETMHVICKNNVFLFLVILILKNVRVYIYILNCYNVATNVKVSVD